MHQAEVTFAFTVPRAVPSGSGLFDVQRDAKARAVLQGITDIAIRRIGVRWYNTGNGVERWRPPHFAYPSKKTKNPLVPRGHIAILVEGLAEKE